MRGADITQAALFSYRSLEERIPSSHPLRKLRVVVDTILVSMDRELDAPEFNSSRCNHMIYNDAT